jgi:hypothetical protein
MTLLQKLAAWYRRRFRGYVAAPRGIGGKGTAWQQHQRSEMAFACCGVTREGKRCGLSLVFTAADYVIRQQEHVEGCGGLLGQATSAGVLLEDVRTGRCSCPVTDARYIKICPGCGLGHWKIAL